MADDIITIDASALASFDYTQYIYDYFANLGTTVGASSWYGGIPYTDASQVGFRYAGTSNDAQVLLQGEGLAYDGAPSHAISGNLDGFSLGSYDANTTSTVVDAETGEVSELQNVIAGLEISGLGYSAASGSGTTNPVYVLYNALRKANTVVDLDADGDSGYEYIDLIYSLLGAKAQHFIGSEGDDVYTGTVNSDLIDGGLGADSLAGGEGDDTYVVDDENDVVTELDGEGTDTIQTSLDNYTLGDFIENLTLTGAAITGNGNGLNNVLIGNDGDNILNGLDGDDTLIGGLGADSLVGGTGNDTYGIDDELDVITELDGEGTDTVETTLDGYTLGDDLENLTLAGSEDLAGTGNALNNVMTGNDGDNTLYGLDGTDTLSGGKGDDTLDGGAGTDTMIGGAGDDIYVTDVSGDLVTELADEGTDTVETARNHYPLGANIENLVQTGSADLFGYGNALDNVMTGNSGVSTLMGQAGNDTLYGGLGADTLNGGEGNDYLDGQDGIDTMIGGAGGDVYVTDVSGETITELADEGTDTVETVRNHYPLGANLENLIQTGNADLFGYGNALDNVMTGNDGNNYLGAIEGNDTLYGGLGIDTLDGGAGNDYLDGGSGTDTMIGGAGDDIFIFGAGDVVSELANGGSDTIRTATNNFALGNFVENLTLTGVANLKATGNSLSNVMTGNTGNNTLSGLLGNDILNGGQGNDTLSGNEGRDTLSGGTGADRLFGGAGQDALTGNAGADSFFFANADTAAQKAWADTILDFSGNQGDLINLVSMDANEARAGNQRFDFIGTARFSGDAGELRYEKTGSDTYIYGDTDGDRRVDFAIHLDDAVNLRSDFFAL